MTEATSVTPTTEVPTKLATQAVAATNPTQTTTLTTVQRLEADLALARNDLGLAITWLQAHTVVTAVLITIVCTLLLVKIL